MTKLKELMGIIKDKASQGKAAILSKSTTLSLLRATSHNSFTPPTHNHISSLLSSGGDSSRATASSAIKLLMDRLNTTHNSAVALKCLITIHHIIKHGNFILQDQLSVYPYTGGRNYLNLSNFRDKTTPISWELSSYVRWYAQHMEHLLCSCRILGFFLGTSSTTPGRETQEERVSGLINCDLLREIDSLLAIVEGIGKRPNYDPSLSKKNKLVDEIVGLVENDGVVALSELYVRVNEFRERLGSLSFGEGVELVYDMKRLEECKERMMGAMLEVAEVQRLWDSVRELKEKVGVEVYREKGKLFKTVARNRGSESDRFAGRVPNSADLIRFRSSRFL